MFFFIFPFHLFILSVKVRIMNKTQHLQIWQIEKEKKKLLSNIAALLFNNSQKRSIYGVCRFLDLLMKNVLYSRNPSLPDSANWLTRISGSTYYFDLICIQLKITVYFISFHYCPTLQKVYLFSLLFCAYWVSISGNKVQLPKRKQIEFPDLQCLQTFMLFLLFRGNMS